jgi:hypothetical protein
MAAATRLIRKNTRVRGRQIEDDCFAKAAGDVNVNFMVVEYLVNLKALSDLLIIRLFLLFVSPCFPYD